VANTLAYYDTATITAVKSFIAQAPAYSADVSVENILMTLTPDALHNGRLVQVPFV
jgi:hypothetical protein